MLSSTATQLLRFLVICFFTAGTIFGVEWAIGMDDPPQETQSFIFIDVNDVGEETGAGDEEADDAEVVGVPANCYTANTYIGSGTWRITSQTCFFNASDICEDD